jgi:hypothetical protein
MRELLGEMEAGLPDLNREEPEKSLTEWLQSVREKVHPVEEFMAGSFGRHINA